MARTKSKPIKNSKVKLSLLERSRLVLDKQSSSSRVAASERVPIERYFRRRPGTAALSEIRVAQKETRLIIAKASFKRLVKETVEIVFDKGLKRKLIGNVFPTGNFRFNPDALEAIQEDAEFYLIKIMKESLLNCIHGNRVTVNAKDVIRETTRLNLDITLDQEILEPVKNVTNPAIKKLARRAGITRISIDFYDQCISVLKYRLKTILGYSILYTENCNRNTIFASDVVNATHRSGMLLYGF
jgi:histone H3/H4